MYKLFIVSNCQDGYIECFFKAHKLDKYFTDYECPGRTGLSKGENNKLIIERNNLKNPGMWEIEKEMQNRQRQQEFLLYLLNMVLEMLKNINMQ